MKRYLVLDSGGFPPDTTDYTLAIQSVWSVAAQAPQNATRCFDNTDRSWIDAVFWVSTRR